MCPVAEGSLNTFYVEVAGGPDKATHVHILHLCHRTSRCTFLFVATSNITAALADLRHEYEDVCGQVDTLREKLGALETRQNRLSEAIQSLESLNSAERGGVDVQPSAASATASPGESAGQRVRDAQAIPPVERRATSDDSAGVHEALVRYAKRGGTSRRLSSITMISDVLDNLGRAVSRNELKDAFFEHFPREALEEFWARPDNAFSTALARAVSDGAIETAKDGGVDVYASRAVAARYGAGRQVDRTGEERKDR